MGHSTSVPSRFSSYLSFRATSQLHTRSSLRSYIFFVAKLHQIWLIRLRTPSMSLGNPVQRRYCEPTSMCSKTKAWMMIVSFLLAQKPLRKWPSTSPTSSPFTKTFSCEFCFLVMNQVLFPFMYPRYGVIFLVSVFFGHHRQHQWFVGGRREKSEGREGREAKRREVGDGR